MAAVISYRQFAGSLEPSHRFSSTFNRKPTASRTLAHLPSRPTRIWPPGRWAPPLLAGRPALRFSSTNADPTFIPDSVPDYTPPSEGFSSIGDEYSFASASVQEYPGWLKDIGLDYGWGTTAMVERLLEYVHIYTGTPWWASITISVLLVRAALLKFYFDASDTTARTQIIKPYTDPLQKRFRAAQATKNRQDLKKAWDELSALRKAAGVQTWKQFVPLVQIPIGFGTFRLMRGMSTLPVPGLETGGFLWIKDLTLSDPYFILPFATSASMFMTFKLGGETGTQNQVSPQVKKFFQYFMPPIIGLFMLGWPAALQWTFCIQGLLALIQTRLLTSPWFRDMIGIQQMPGHFSAKKTQETPAYGGTSIKYQAPVADSTPVPNTGFSISEFKSGISKWYREAKEKAEEQQKPPGRRTAAELKHAKAYDERRKREIALQRQAETLEREERENEVRKRQRH